jgi:nucleoside-diphosphate-sugar epimerase
MLAATLGTPYTIPFGGRFDMQFADDVAQAFIRASRVPFEGAEVFKLRGSVVRAGEIVAAIEDAVPEMRGKLTFVDTPLSFPEEMDGTPLISALGSLPHTSLSDGVALTIDTFREAIRDGRMSPEL